MKHLEAIRHLPVAAEGALDTATEAALWSHVSDCSDCYHWLMTRNLLCEELQRGEDEIPWHPESSVLALCVVRPEEIYEPGRERLRSHLAECATCRQMIDRVTPAVVTARPQAFESSDREAPSTFSGPAWVGAVAAAAAPLLIGIGILLVTLILGYWDSGFGYIAERIAPPAPQPPEDAVAELLDRDLEGTQLIQTGRGLMVARVMVKEGADVAFEAADVVALGDGFQVAAGGRLRVSSGSSVSGQRASDSARSEEE